MSVESTATPRRERVPLNGVDTPNLLATINAVKGQPALAKFQFRAQNQWVRGTQSRSRIESFSGAGGEQKHTTTFEYDADHPLVLVGGDAAATPVEFLLHALASCLTAGLANIASTRGVTLERVESTIEGDIDLQGILGLSNEVRNGYSAIRVHFNIAGDAPPEKLMAIVDQARNRSAVYDVLTKGVPIEMSVAVV